MNQQQARDVIVTELQRQARLHPGFRADTTTDRELFAVHGVLSVDELAHAISAADEREGEKR